VALLPLLEIDADQVTGNLCHARRRVSLDQLADDGLLHPADLYA
jgi:hypothetical protein